MVLSVHPMWDTGMEGPQAATVAAALPRPNLGRFKGFSPPGQAVGSAALSWYSDDIRTQRGASFGMVPDPWQY